MFDEVVCESAWANRSHRAWTTVASFSVQGFLVGVLLVMPLVYPEGLPRLKLIVTLSTPEPPPGPPAPVAPAQRHSATAATSNLLTDGRVLEPQSIPRETPQITDAVVPAPVGIRELGVVGGVGDRWSKNPVLHSIARAASFAPPAPAIPVVRQPPLSHAMEAYLVHRVQPEYPPLARAVRVQGTVVLRAIIAKDGTIENLRVVSGHPMLVQAAANAVQQWRYRPYVLNGEAVEVETQITVNFVLSGG